MSDVAELYEQDFYAWTQAQAAELHRLKALRLNVPLDIDHIAEEIEDLGGWARRTVRSRTRRILEHLLKLRFSQAQEPRRSWQQSILDARHELEEDLTATLRHDLAAEFDRLYGQARRAAIMGLEDHGEAAAASLMPTTSPFTLEDVLRHDWYPEPDEPRSQ